MLKWLFRPSLLLLVALALAAYAAALTYWTPSAESRPEPRPVPSGDQEIAFLYQATNGATWERFVTAVLAFLRQHGRRVQVRLAGCGHPGPAVVRADGRVEMLEPDGMPLGLFDGAQASQPELELELRQGDLLLFYTDGVTEARSADLEFFEDRLADELAAFTGRTAAETVRAVQELVTSFSQGDLRDDVTILAVKVVP